MPGPAKAVSVVTPFYNTADYLAECIESVLCQTLRNFEYILADNASTDGSDEIARKYAEQDSRIRFIRFEEHLPQVLNYNRALLEADCGARYCKVIQADDLLLPTCLEEMVRLADSDDEIGLVGSYTIRQHQVFLDGLDFYERVVDGDEFLRRYLLDGPYIVGNPTTHMYRMADVQARPCFYSEQAPFEDTEAGIELVLGRKFGFVHQTLSFVRTSNNSISTRRRSYNIDALTRRVLHEKYGRKVFPADTFAHIRRRLRWRHYRVLGEARLLGQSADFWTLHLHACEDAGIPIRWSQVYLGSLIVVLRWVANPEDTLRRLWAWVRQ